MESLTLALKIESLPLVYKTLGFLKTWNELHSNKTRLQYNKQFYDLEYIPIGWFDGAVQSNGEQSGVGRMIRITKNSIYKLTFNCGSGTNTMEQLLGAWDMINLASKLHIETMNRWS
jgi:hypothetical protein